MVLTWTRSLPGTIIGVEPCAGTTMNVAQWLNAIDLGQYEANFRDNKSIHCPNQTRGPPTPVNFELGLSLLCRRMLTRLCYAVASRSDSR
jgi:hypothetical protein